MRVELHTADAGGCGHYRLVWPGQAAAALGVEVRTRVPGSDDPPELPTWWVDGRVVGLRKRTEGWPDVVVLQRPLRWELVEAARALRAEGVAVVVELDDDFAAVSPRSVAWSPRMPVKVAALRAACAEADLVTVSTSALAERYAPHGRVAVLPNLAPPHLAARPPAEHRRVAGWTGSVTTHVDDLLVLKESGCLARALRAADGQFHVVGTGAGVSERAGRPVDLAHGWRDLTDGGDGGYYWAVGQLGIGLAPLALTPFNEAKSWLKPLEYAAVGVPCVVSPTSEYRRLAARVPSVFVADAHWQWRQQLQTWLTDTIAWSEVAEAGYAAVRAEYLLSDRAHLWAEAWETAVNNRTKEHR